MCLLHLKFLHGPDDGQLTSFRIGGRQPEALNGHQSFQTGWALLAADIKALDQTIFNLKHVTDHLIR
jgi:hypothetical protein